MVNVRNYITIDKDVLGGQPVFFGTRVPVDTLFNHLEKGITVEEFLEDFPTVTKDQALSVLEIAGKLLNSSNLYSLYEAAA
jgi:uncharacterized protein (DUF433 family)